jgi:hypothetical protein
MEQSSNDAALTDALIKLRGEEYVVDTELTATLAMNLQHLNHVLDQKLKIPPRHFPIGLIQPPL